MDGGIGKIYHLNHFNTPGQLFFYLLKDHVIACQADRHAGYGPILRSSDREAVQIIGFAGKQAGDSCQDTDIIFYKQADPSFFHHLSLPF